jgi:hypothetical protein
MPITIDRAPVPAKQFQEEKFGRRSSKLHGPTSARKKSFKYFAAF